jgi:hypothetical protein
MSTKNSTEDKLIASIQKTRSGGTAKVKPKATAKKAVKKKAAAKPAASVSNREQKKILINAFQHGRRVWPD